MTGFKTKVPENQNIKNHVIKDTPLSVFLIIFSRLIIFLVGFPLLITAAIFSCKGHIYNNSAILTSSAALSTLLAMILLRKSYRITIRILLLNLLIAFTIIGTTTLLVTRFYDKSWDGLTYHQMAILQLKKGWNPFYEQLPDASMKSEYTGRTENMNLYINHYAKGSEIFAAVVMSATGSIESGKVFNLLLMLSAFGSVLFLFNKLDLFSEHWNFVIATAAALNPIAANQIFSYDVDGALGSVVLLLICHCVLLLLPDEKDRSFIYTTLFFLIILLVNLKFTGAVYLAWVGAAFIFIAIYLRKLQLIRKFVVATGISGILAVLLVGFNPYVLNTYHFGHPLYPIAGANKLDLITRVMPQEFESLNSLQKFANSTFSRCENFDTIEPGRSVKLKVPFTFSIEEIKTFQSEATRLAGFGVLWSGIFCLSILCSLFLFTKLSARTLLYFTVLLLVILLSVLTNPASWWARFVPQLWLLPVIVSVFMMLDKNKIQNLVGKIILTLLIVNSLTVAATYTYSSYANTVQANKHFDELKNASGPVFVYFDIFTPHAEKFEDQNISYVRVLAAEELPCKNKLSFLKIKVCIPEKK